MQNGARFFAYFTWVVMISLAIIITTNRFLGFVADPGWVGLVALLVFGLIYLNFAYAAIKRFIKKIPEPTNLHYVLGASIFLPSAIWIIFISDFTAGSEIILTIVLAFSCGLGTYYGNKVGIKERYEYIQKLKKEQAEQAGKVD